MTTPSANRPRGVRAGGHAMSLALAALVVLFVVSHLPRLVTAPSDVDEVNFVMGVRNFDVASHQPHPPGYPVFIALGKIAAPVSRWWGVPPADVAGPAVVESRALAFFAALLGGLGLVPLVLLLRALDDRPDVAFGAAALTAVAPLYWFTAARPLSDVPGLAAVLLVNALVIAAWRRQSPDQTARAIDRRDLTAERLMFTAAVAAGLTAGIRSQTFWLVAPFFAFVVATWRGPRVRLLVGCGLLWTAIAAWLIPAAVATGGPQAYLGAFRWQFTEDLALVDMLWTQPTPQNILQWISTKYLHPWGILPLAATVLLLAAVGAAGLRRARTAALPLAVVFVPYLLFDALFQEVVTVRYALPGVPLVAYLAVRGLADLAPGWWRWGAGLLVAGSLVVSSLALADQARELPPVSKVLADMRAPHDNDAADALVLAMHEPYRPLMRDEPLADRILPLTPLREWLDLVRFWLDGQRGPIWFLADPRRAGLAEFDPRSRRLVHTYAFVHRWSFTGRLLGGSRPARVQWWELGQPGWMLGEGWALTPEAGGVAREGHRGPHEAPAVASIRRRPEAAVLMIGGRHLAPGDPRPVTLAAAIDGRPIAQWTVPANPGWFLEWIELAPGRLMGSGAYAELTVRATSPGSPPVGLEQFDVQSAGADILAYADGWHELEYDNRKGALWRWTSDRAALVVRHGGRDLTLRIAGESPLKYFAAPPTVTVRAGGRMLLRFMPAADFSEEVTVPASLLEWPAARLVIDTDRTFVPAERGPSPDRRRLGLRIYNLSLQ